MQSEAQTVLITGASGGVGIEITKNLLESGLRKLALHYRSQPETLFELCRKYDLDPAQTCFQAELTDEASVKNLRLQVESKIAPVDAVVGLAGASTNALSWKMSLSDFRNILDSNFTSTFLVNREFIPSMRERAFGRLINVSSVVAHTGVAGASHYCGAKAAVIGFSKSVALELASKNITVNVLALGYFDYGMLFTVPENLRETIRSKIPLQRFGKANELAGLIRFLLSRDSAYMTGQVLHINGGLYG